MTETELARCTLPGNLEVFCINAGEAKTLYREIFVQRCWLEGGIRLEPGGTVVDAGANIGLSTLFFHRECSDQRFLCFEPAPAPFAALQGNVAMYDIDAICRPVALGANAGEVTMTYYPQITAMSGLYAEPSREADITRTFLRNCNFSGKAIDRIVPSAYEAVPVKAEVRTLSAEVLDAGFDRIDLLKIDVEKSELDLLAGIGQDTWDIVRQVAVEVHNSDEALAKVRALLDAQGFDVKISQDPLFRGTELYDVTAIRRGSR